MYHRITANKSDFSTEIKYFKRGRLSVDAFVIVKLQFVYTSQNVDSGPDALSCNRRTDAIQTVHISTKMSMECWDCYTIFTVYNGNDSHFQWNPYSMDRTKWWCWRLWWWWRSSTVMLLILTDAWPGRWPIFACFSWTEWILNRTNFPVIELEPTDNNDKRCISHDRYAKKRRKTPVIRTHWSWANMKL